jgi:two-component system NarL family sensor kinase
VHLEESQRALEESRLKLRESLEQYRLLAENAMDIVYALNVAGRYTYVNKAIEMVAGYTPEEMIDRHFSEFLPDALQTARLDSFERRMRGEDEGSSAEIDFRAKDGRLVPLELRLAVIRRDGQIVGMQGIARDVTRRRSMEAEIRRLAEQERRRADQLQEAAHVGQRIARLSSLDVLLPNVVTLLHERFGYERVALFLIDKDTSCAVLRAWAGDFAAPMPKVFSLEPGEGLVGLAALHGEVIRTGDVKQDPHFVEIPATAGTSSEVAVPIRSGGQMLGVLAVGSKQLDALDVNDEAMLVILSRQIATVIQNSRLFEQQHSLAVAEERNRLAREIHDTLAQGLTGITLQLEVADALLDVDTDQARAKINKALELTRANLEEARRSVMDLRAAPLQERTLPAALEELVGTFGREHEVRAAFGSQGVAGRLPAPIEAGLYRIAQEALNNIAKHADPSAVEVVLEEVDGELVLAVEDDGGGFDPTVSPTDRRRGGFGLVGMKERARLLGGELEVNSSPGHGTQIVVRVPAPKARTAAAVTAGTERR